jgi:hypothetical protein
MQVYKKTVEDELTFTTNSLLSFFRKGVPIHERCNRDELHSDMARLHADRAELHSNMARLHAGRAELHSDMARLHADSASFLLINLQ